MSSKKILTGPGKLSGVSRNGPQGLLQFASQGRIVVTQGSHEERMSEAIEDKKAKNSNARE